jgi:hypothetical protein
MKWILVSIGFILLFGIAVRFVIDLKNKLKEEQDDFENGNSIKQQ